MQRTNKQMTSKWLQKYGGKPNTGTNSNCSFFLRFIWEGHPRSQRDKHLLAHVMHDVLRDNVCEAKSCSLHYIITSDLCQIKNPYTSLCVTSTRQRLMGLKKTKNKNNDTTMISCVQLSFATVNRVNIQNSLHRWCFHIRSGWLLCLLVCFVAGCWLFGWFIVCFTHQA